MLTTTFEIDGKLFELKFRTNVLLNRVDVISAKRKDKEPSSTYAYSDHSAITGYPHFLVKPLPMFEYNIWYDSTVNEKYRPLISRIINSTKL